MFIYKREIVKIKFQYNQPPELSWSIMANKD